MCKQLDNSLVNAIEIDENCHKPLQNPLAIFQILKNNINQELSNYDNNYDTDDNSETDSSEVGSVLLEEFPCVERSANKSIFSRFNHRERSIFKRKRPINFDDSMIDMDATTIRKGMSSMSLDKINTSRSSNIDNQEVKHAMIDSDQLEYLKKCTSPCLKSYTISKDNDVNIEKLINKNRLAASMYEFNYDLDRSYTSNKRHYNFDCSFNSI